MRILILGGDGMLGHQLLKSWQSAHEVQVTLRNNLSAYKTFGLFHKDNSSTDIDACNFESVATVVKAFKPEAVVNAVGIVKQRAESHDAIPSLEINALLPHRLSVMCGEAGARLIHISTDCVFSGSKGKYAEGDPEDASDLYGRTKLLGEVTAPHAVTLRTSIIGQELSRKSSLIEWFLQQKGVIKGFDKAIYSGFTTLEMAHIMEKILLEQTGLSGLWHVASHPISKYALLQKLAAALGRKDIEIERDETFVCDRSLNGTRFNQATGYEPPSWETMLSELAQHIKEGEK